MLPLEDRLLKENPSVRHETPPCELSVKEVPEAHRTTQSTVIAFGQPSEPIYMRYNTLWLQDIEK